MNTPYLRQAPNGIFTIHWTENRVGKRRSTRTTDPAKARRALAGHLLERGIPASEPTVAELWALYETKHLVHTAAPQTAGYSWKRLAPHFGALRPNAVTPDVVDTYVQQRKVRSSTVRRELAHLNACLNFGRARGVLAVVPKIRRPADAAPRDRWLTTAEIAKLLAAVEAGGRLYVFIHLALETGARKSALRELTWDRVDFETGVIHLDTPGRRQTKKRRASVPISKTLEPVLQIAYCKRTTDLVLENGSDVWLRLRRAARRAGLAGVHPHVLRHTAATHMARRGVPLWKIAKVLGNRVAQIERVYAKHAPDDLREAVDSISGPR